MYVTGDQLSSVFCFPDYLVNVWIKQLYLLFTLKSL